MSSLNSDLLVPTLYREAKGYISLHLKFRSSVFCDNLHRECLCDQGITQTELAAATVVTPE